MKPARQDAVVAPAPPALSATPPVKAYASLVPIALIIFVDAFGLTLVFPVLGPYAERFHASPLQAMLLVSTFSACQLFSSPLLGKLSDRFGRRPILLVSQVGTLLGFVVLAKAQVLWVLYLARALDGCTAGNFSVAQAYIADNTPPEGRARAFGILNVAFGLGFMFGPGLSGLLAHSASFNAPIWLAAGFSFTSIVCTAFLLPEERKAPVVRDAVGSGPAPSVLDVRSYGRYFQRPVLNGLLFEFFFYMLSFSTFTSGFSLFAERALYYRGHLFGMLEIGFAFCLPGLLGAALQGTLIGPLVKRFGEARLVAVGFVLLVGSYLGLGVIHGVAALVVLSVFSAAGNGLVRPSLTGLISRQVGEGEQGVVLGVTQSLNASATIVAPFVGGVLLNGGHLSAWAWFAAVACVGGLAVGRLGSARLGSARDA